MKTQDSWRTQDPTYEGLRPYEDPWLYEDRGPYKDARPLLSILLNTVFG